MNIFVLDMDKTKCAQYHVDRHVVKMITEYCQLLNSAYYFTGQEDIANMKLTHKNHPSAIWVRESLSNWFWLQDLAVELYIEYQHRYGNKEHKSGEKILSMTPPNLVDIGLTEFKLAMPTQYYSKDAVKAYRKYYIGDKQHLFNWKHRQQPAWI